MKKRFLMIFLIGLFLSSNAYAKRYYVTYNNYFDKKVSGRSYGTKSFKNSNKLGVSCLLIMVKRGHEVDMEYSKKQILDKMNNYFGYSVVEKLKLISFDDDQTNFKKTKINHDVTNSKYMNKIVDFKNDKIKKSLIELSKLFKQK